MNIKKKLGLALGMCAILTMLSGCGEEKKASDESKMLM